MTEPITIPAIAPLESPGPWLAALPVADAVGVLLDVDEGNRRGTDLKVGSITPGQRLFAFDPSQHESVAFGELFAQ